jgi:hypothetical protein
VSRKIAEMAEQFLREPAAEKKRETVVR